MLEPWHRTLDCQNALSDHFNRHFDSVMQRASIDRHEVEKGRPTPLTFTRGLHLAARTLAELVAAIVSTMPEGADVSNLAVRLQLERRMKTAAGSLGVRLAG